MRVKDNRWVISSRDLWHASVCEHCLYQSMFVAAGLPLALAKVEAFKPDLDNTLPIIQGKEFEEMVLAELKAQLGDEMVILPERSGPEALDAALAANPAVIAQGFLIRDFGSVTLTGYADLLVREDLDLVLDSNRGVQVAPAPGVERSGRYTVWDIKHSSEAKLNYQIQVGGYLVAMQAMAIASSRPSGLLLRNRSTVAFEPDHLVNEFNKVFSEVQGTLSHTSPNELLIPREFEWFCPEPGICKKIHCEYPDLCSTERVRLNQISQLYDVNAHHRKWLLYNDIHTITDVIHAGSDYELEKPDGDTMDAKFWRKYYNWATVIQAGRDIDGPVMQLTRNPQEILADLPEPHPADLFFDFEWFGPTGQTEDLHYMLGATDNSDVFFEFSAKDFDSERAAFEGFVEFALNRMRVNSGAHIYHYNDPEKTRLRKLVDRYGSMSTEVDELIGYLFDLMPVVRNSMINSYGKLGIKTLEHFYAHTDDSDEGIRGDTEVADGADSQLKFYRFLQARAAGDYQAEQELWRDIVAYNKADCISTRMLFHWMRERLGSYSLVGQRPTCPRCGEPVRRVVYGYPGADLMNDPTVSLGGCIVFPDEEQPMFDCKCLEP